MEIHFKQLIKRSPEGSCAPFHYSSIFAALALLTAVAGHHPPASARQAPPALASLANGLTLAVIEDRRAPIVIQQVWYGVGGGDEDKGTTGLSHFLEHMMFKGEGPSATSAGEGKGPFSDHVARLGGQSNAWTSQDHTVYHIRVAKQHLEQIMGLEAKRMHRLSFIPEEVDLERDVVLQEKRERSGGEVELWNKMLPLLFADSGHRFPVIGLEEDLVAADAAALRKWYQRWYHPANALVMIIGDVDAAETLAKARLVYGSVPPRCGPPGQDANTAGRTRPRRIKSAPALFSAGPQRVSHRGKNEVTKAVISWRVPSLASAHRPRDAYALLMLMSVLSGSHTSLLDDLLIVQQKKAASVGASYSLYSRGDGLFEFWLTPLPGVALDDLAELVLREVEKKQSILTDRQALRRATNFAVANAHYGNESMFSRARQAGRLLFAGFDPSPEVFERRLRALTPADLRRVARRYLRTENRLIGYLLPASGGGGAKAPSTTGEPQS